MVDEIIAEMRTMATEMDKEAARGTQAVNGHMDKMSEKATIAARRTTLFKKAVSGVKKSQQEYGDSLHTNQQMLKKLPELYADGQIGLAQYSSSLDEFGAHFAPMEVKAFRAMSSIKDGFHNMAGSVTDVFYNMFTGVTSAFDGLKQIAGMVFQMVAKALIQALIVRPLIGAITGGMGIPFFANGGFAKEGQPAIVGERGPELIIPSSNSRIVSNTNMRNMSAGGGTGVGGDTAHVTFNINAVSTRDGVEFLLQNKNTITGVVQEAFNRRGSSGPLG
jgi:phage-related minor tail protein